MNIRNKSLKELRKEEVNARKRAKDPIAINKTEFPIDDIVNMDYSRKLMNNHLDNNCMSSAWITVSDTERYYANDLMLPSHLKKGKAVIQRVPKELSDKIDNIFKVNSSYHKQYMMLRLYLNGFTTVEIAEFYGLDASHKTTVSKYINIAMKKIIDNLTPEELYTVRWWLKLSNEEVKTLTRPPMTPFREVTVKATQQAVNPWYKMNELYRNAYRKKG